MNRFLPPSFFEWCVNTPLARMIKSSMWDFAVLETIHIIGLALLLGSIFVTNLAVLGLGLRQPAGRVAKNTLPWGLAGFVLIVASGIPMFVSAATTYSGSFPFLLKMLLLAAAIVLQFAILRYPSVQKGTPAGKAVAVIALVCWFGVAYAGRAIAFDVLLNPGD
jgi:hypothetical protein